MPRVPEEQTEQPEELQVHWMPAFPAAAITLILTAVLFPIGVLLSVAGLAVVIVRAVQRRWDVWAWVGAGTLVGAAAYWALILLHSVF